MPPQLNGCCRKNGFTYQGDGDLASIGMGEIIHASLRAEKITVILSTIPFYGMTGGQMAPTTLLGQVTTTSPYGRKKEWEGYPAKMAELLAQTSEGSAYICRTSVHKSGQCHAHTKKAIKKALQIQQAGLGFTMGKSCRLVPPTGDWVPLDALAWLENNMIPYYPLGEFKVKEEE